MKERKNNDQNDEPEVLDLTPEEQNLRRTLFEVYRKNPKYFESLRRTIHNIVGSYPSIQWRGTKIWNDDDLETIYKKVEGRLLHGNLIRFWLAARTDECMIRTNLNNIVFNIIYSMATDFGRLFHSHTANQLKSDPRFIKQKFYSKKHRHSFLRIGLEKWNSQKPTELSTDQLFEKWRREVKLPAFTSAHSIMPAARAEIFIQMLELANGYVNSKDFYNGYRKITGFAFNRIDHAVDLNKSEDNEEQSASSEFDMFFKCNTQTDANVREDIRLAIVEGFDSWKPAIDKLLSQQSDSLAFLKCFFLETGVKKKEAAEKLNKEPSWATKQLKTFQKNLSQVFAEANLCEETEQRAFVQLIINKLAVSDSGVNQQCR